MTSKKRVVITGIGVVSPLGCDLKSSWDVAIRGESGIGPITLFDASGFSCRIAAEVKNFELERFIPRAFIPVELLHRGAQFGVAATVMALKNAKLWPFSYTEPERVGVCLGVSGYSFDLASLARWAREDHNLSISLEYTLNHSASTSAWVIANLVGAQGPNIAINTACSSSSHAIGTSARLIQRGNADIVITGGYESPISETGLLRFCLVGALSQRNEQPQKASRPFDRRRDGFILGEGGIILILEELSCALSRGAKIYAEVAGWGSSLDGYSLTESLPDGSQASEAIQSALKDAGLEPGEVDYINAHGTSTWANDRAETLAIKRAFGEKAYKVPISSTKSMTGHLLSAAGALEAAFSILTIQHGIIPPTINYEYPDPKCDLDYVPNQARREKVDIALSNSFGFGGTNSCLIFRSYKDGS
jgi:3-oxoacyl-[acyl-carrier-protein] synthase II